MEKVNLSSDEGLKNTWEYAKLRSYGYSWPERNYICSFCKKELKSAQALGGHMNVHRRERAKMRVPLLPGDYPNPNNIFSSASSTSPENGFLAPNSSLATAADAENVLFHTPFDHMGKGLNKRAFTQVTLEEAAPFATLESLTNPLQNVLLRGIRFSCKTAPHE